MTADTTLNLSDHDRAGVAGTLHTPDPAAVERLRALMAQQTLAALKACAILHGYIVGLQRVADDATADPATHRAIEEEMRGLLTYLESLTVDLPAAGRVGE